MGEDSRVSIDYLHLSSSESSLETTEVRHSIFEALSKETKDISAWPKYLYDTRGSEIFEKITEQPEYYQTRTELSILRRFSGDITQGDLRELVELGSGSSSKTRALLEAMIQNHGAQEIKYIPLDVSESAVEDGANRLRLEYPSIEISGYIGDFDGTVGKFLSFLPGESGGQLIIFLGGTIGNFTPSRRRNFLEDVGSGMKKEDRFLVGLDLVKDISTLEAAYNDAEGVTAKFNKNVLCSINEKIGSGFDPDLFEHQALYNQEESRIEMWLVSTRDQDIDLGDGALSVHFAESEGLRTEISAKFTRESIYEMFECSGMRLVELYTDERELFGLALVEPE